VGGVDGRAARVPPLIVIEGSDQAFEAVVVEVQAAGWSVAPGFAVSSVLAGRTVHAGAVTSAVEAGAALMVALGGNGVVVVSRGSQEVMDRLFGDLGHVGRVDHRSSTDETVATLGPSEQAVLALLAQGHSLGETARLLGLSRRTADRRLAEARRRLGVERTSAAIARARRLRLLG
jgi:DNA-binding CsgD family transcriptional regulator